jgi:coenzyme F420-reducing hydrogenase beta subunit
MRSWALLYIPCHIKGLHKAKKKPYFDMENSESTKKVLQQSKNK